tara:strand:- start:248 stop:490 length:243 start_codon:yes stop_codon:yes gene_type:complete
MLKFFINKYVIMTRFINIIKKYERVATLGKQIIRHKEKIKRVRPCVIEINNQEKRIEEFIKEADDAHRIFKNNIVNEYWT